MAHFYEIIFLHHYMDVTKPHVFISKKHPLIHKEVLTLEDLEPYPCFTFDQGAHDAFYLWEEILPAMKHKKEVHVHDRAFFCST